jgi:SHOCT-like protein
MTADRKKVLEMLAAGKITPDEAEKLLEKLDASPASRPDAQSAQPGEPAAEGKQPRFLRILVERPNHDQVNVRLPLSLCRTGKLLAFLPTSVSERLAERGIDLSGFNSLRGEDLEAALRTINIDVEKDGGKKVRIFCE